MLVPPLFERDHRGRSRMANSSYDWLFAKPALKWLFHDYIDNNAHALLRLSPGEDPRVSITARVHSSLRGKRNNKVVVAEETAGSICNATFRLSPFFVVQLLLHSLFDTKRSPTLLRAGSMTLRYQLSPTEPLTFLDVKVGKQVSALSAMKIRSSLGEVHNNIMVFCAQGNTAQARACYFDVANKWGAWASLPLTAGHDASPVFGARYSTPAVTAGGMISPTEGSVKCLWLVSNQLLALTMHPIKG